MAFIIPPIYAVLEDGRQIAAPTLIGGSMLSPSLPTRKKTRLSGFDYASAGAYFVTICISERQPILWDNPDCFVTCADEIQLNHIGKTIQDAIREIPVRYPHIQVEKYCIMPDHVHLLLIFLPDEDGRQIAAPTLSGVVGHLKRWVSMQLGFSIWQKSFHDHVIRDEAGYREVWQYIDENPIKMSLREHHTKY